jgi:hypothetical protein
LRKADGAVSPLAIEGDFGEQQITVKDPSAFAVGKRRAPLADHSPLARVRSGRENRREAALASI